MAHTIRWLSIIGWLLAASVQCSRGGAPAVPEDPAPAAPSTASSGTPAAPPPTAAAPGTIAVRTVRELVGALGPDRVIELAAGDYLLRDTNNNGDPNLQPSRESYEGLSPYYSKGVVRRVRNLTLRPAAGASVRLLRDDYYAAVLAFADVSSVRIEGLAAGHSEPGFCQGGVLVFARSRDVVVSDCDLFGSGTAGFHLLDVDGFELRRSTVHDCTEQGAEIAFSRRVLVTDTTFRNNTFLLGGLRINSSDVTLERTRFANNQGERIFEVDAGAGLYAFELVADFRSLDNRPSRPSRVVVDGRPLRSDE